MKKKILLLAALCLPLVALRATEPEALNIVRINAAMASTLLNEVQRITFNEEETIMSLNLTDETSKDFALVDVQYLAFGAYSAEDGTLTEVPDTQDSMLDTRGVQKVLENGCIYIIQNGIRYNILGIRL